MLKKYLMKSKKLVAVLVAVAVIGTATVSDAWVVAAIRIIAASWKACPPEVKAQIASAAVHVGVFVAGALMYSLKSSGDGSHKADNSGNIKRTGDVTWIDLTDGKTVKQTDATAKVNHNDIKSKVNDNPSKYPKLKNALSTKDCETINSMGQDSASSKVGKKIQVNGTWYLIGSLISEQIGQSGSSATYSNVYSGQMTVDSVTGRTYNGKDQFGNDVYSYDHTVRKYNVTSTTEPGNRDSTPSEFADKIRNGAPENVYSDYYGEIDDFIQSNPNVVHFVDPADENTPAVPDYASLAKQAVVAAQDNTESAKSAAESAQTAATNARARANADPTNAALANAADRAEAAALAAKQKLDEAYAAEKKAETEAEKEDGAKGSVAADGEHSAYGVDGEFNYGSRITGFINNIRNSALFSLPDRVLGNVPGGGSPIQTINMGTRFGTHSLDWSKFDPVWSVLKAVFLICVGVSCVKIVSRGGAG